MDVCGRLKDGCCHKLMEVYLFELEDAPCADVPGGHHLYGHVLANLIQLQHLQPHLQLTGDLTPSAQEPHTHISVRMVSVLCWCCVTLRVVEPTCP